MVKCFFPLSSLVSNFFFFLLKQIKPKKKHTILLVQFTNERSTRHYDDYETVFQAMDGF